MIDIDLEMVQQLWLNLQQGLLPDLGGWNYMLIAILIMLQGRASAVIGGIAAATGYLNLGLIILVAVVARVIVDLFWYRVGATGLIDRLGRYAALYRNHVDNINESIQNRPTRLILMSKIVNTLAVPVTIAIGNARVPLRRWLPASFLGELLWVIPLLLIGFFATDALSNVKGGILYITGGSLMLMALLSAARLVKARLSAARNHS